MTTAQKDPVVVVVQLSGGNDYLNTVIPYNNEIYYDNRPTVGIPQEQVLHLNDEVGLHPQMGPIRDMYEQGNVAIIHAVGYENSIRSHFRSMDIWHTCEPDDVGTEGWLGKVIREIDPHKENVVTGVSFGPSMFRAMAVPGVPVACVEDLNNYGLMPGISAEEQRQKILNRFSRLYGQAIGRGPVMEFLGQTGLDALQGADILKLAPERYSSGIEYADTTLAKKLKGIAQVHMAGLGSRVFYCDHGSFDSHAGQPNMLAGLWDDLSTAINDFFDDLRAHDASDNVVMLLFSEFRDGAPTTTAPARTTARRARLWSSETMLMAVSTESTHRSEPKTSSRAMWCLVLISAASIPRSSRDWMKMDAKSIVGGGFENLGFIAN